MIHPNSFETCRLAVLDLIRNSESHARTTDDSVFERIALELFRLQWNFVPAYRQFSEQKGLQASGIDHWRQIPEMPTAGFKLLELSSIPPKERTRVFHSSGTTQSVPSKHHHSAASLEIYEASLLSGFRRAMLSAEERTANDWPGMELHLVSLCPPPALAPHSSLSHMIGCVSQSLHWNSVTWAGTTSREGTWQVHLARLIPALEAITRTNQPAILTGTAFLWVHLLDYLAKSGRTFQLPEGSRVMETGGYKGLSRSIPKQELHHWISQSLGIPLERIICEYGMSELGSQAYDGLDGIVPSGPRIFQWPDWTRFLIFCPEKLRPMDSGSPGLLRVLDLANVFSVFTVQTEDLATANGIGFELHGRAADSEPRGCSLRSA